MKTKVVLVVMLLALGLAAAPGLAEAQAAGEQILAGCQPLYNAELSLIRGRQTNLPRLIDNSQVTWSTYCTAVLDSDPPPSEQNSSGLQEQGINSYEGASLILRVGDYKVMFSGPEIRLDRPSDLLDSLIIE
jgi:hypothetical protein